MFNIFQRDYLSSILICFVRGFHRRLLQIKIIITDEYLFISYKYLICTIVLLLYVHSTIVYCNNTSQSPDRDCIPLPYTLPYNLVISYNI